MNALIPIVVLVGLFLALPWLAIAFRKYCDTVNRLVTKRRRKTGA